MTFAPEYIIACESMHWLFSLCLGLAVFSLIWLIYGERDTYPMRYVFSLFSASCVVFAMHYVLDSLQWGW